MICTVFVLQVVKRKYHQEYDIAPPITFVGDHVALDIPDDGTHTDNGWEVVPLQKAHVSFIIFIIYYWNSFRLHAFIGVGRYVN